MGTHTAAADPDSFLRGVKDCVPTLLGYLSIGFAAGVVEKTAGLSISEIALMSLILYAGSAQFIAAGMIGASSPASIVVTILFVNLRHLLLSAALSPYFRRYTPMQNMLIGSLLTDETFGVAYHKTAGGQPIGQRYMHGLNMTAYLNWFAANIAGAFCAQWISDPQQFGLDFALTGMFIGLFVLSIQSRKNIVKDLIVASCAVIIAVGASLTLSGSTGIIVATILASTIGLVVGKWK